MSHDFLSLFPSFPLSFVSHLLYLFFSSFRALSCPVILNVLFRCFPYPYVFYLLCAHYLLIPIILPVLSWHIFIFCGSRLSLSMPFYIGKSYCLCAAYPIGINADVISHQGALASVTHLYFLCNVWVASLSCRLDSYRLDRHLQ